MQNWVCVQSRSRVPCPRLCVGMSLDPWQNVVAGNHPASTLRCIKLRQRGRGQVLPNTNVPAAGSSASTNPPCHARLKAEDMPTQSRGHGTRRDFLCKTGFVCKAVADCGRSQGVQNRPPNRPVQNCENQETARFDGKRKCRLEMVTPHGISPEELFVRNVLKAGWRDPAPICGDGHFFARHAQKINGGSGFVLQPSVPLCKTLSLCKAPARR